jgi:hypothetical protein
MEQTTKQMIGRLLAEMKANREQMMAKIKTEMETNQEMLARMEARIEADNEKFEVLRDTLVSRMYAHQERTMTCLVKTEVTALEANSVELESAVEHREVPKEHAIVKPVGGLTKQHRGRNLAAERCQKLKERTQ